MAPMRKLMAFILISSALVMQAAPALACDQQLQSFERDCKIQDRFRDVRARLAQKKIDIEQIAEYRVIRFVDRPSWEKAKLAGKGPRWIYEPKPITWDSFDQGITSVDSQFDIMTLNSGSLSQIHMSLFNTAIQDARTDHSLQPGQYRHEGTSGNGFQLFPKCVAGNSDCDSLTLFRRQAMTVIPQDAIDSQKAWEETAGTRFSDVVKAAGGKNVDDAKTYALLDFNEAQNRINYTPSADVEREIEWFMIYAQYNLQALAQGKAAQTPVELAADLQRWLVGIHPFADGNGRTSRAVEDLVLRHFDLPKAPAGDLGQDVLATRKDYRAATYQAFENMLTQLETCAKLYEHRMELRLASKAQKMACATVDKLKDFGKPEEQAPPVEVGNVH